MMDSAATDELVRRLSQIPEEVGAPACFGAPVEQDGHTIIPVARVSFGYGLGFGRGSGSGSKHGGSGADEGGEGEGGGGGGGGSSTPVAVIRLSADSVSVEPIVDSTKIATTSMMVGAWVAFWLFWTVRTITRERAKTQRQAIQRD
ncbi:MAG: hypothetical protein HYX50_02830 [Chloroflexi bacterium]|nr:hypothetical protein [Chloroflexota bacterium]